MVIDRLENFEKYLSLGPRISKALSYLKENDFSQFKAGEYDIDGRDIYAIVCDYALKPVSEGSLEGHRKYVDIQLLAQGGEKIGFVPRTDQDVLKEYDPEADYAFYSGTSSLIRFEQGMFGIFFPDDLHMPGIGSPDEKVRKVVIKVRRDAPSRGSGV